MHVRYRDAPSVRDEVIADAGRLAGAKVDGLEGEIDRGRWKDGLGARDQNADLARLVWTDEDRLPVVRPRIQADHPDDGLRDALDREHKIAVRLTLVQEAHRI